jgi:protocatechuate 3,4-dioxygenase beta subunit
MDHRDPEQSTRRAVTRRRFAAGLVGGIAAVVGGVGGCRAGASPGPASAAGTDSGGGTTATRPACTLYPQQTAGPFYLDLDRLRGDITEGRAGTPLTLSLQVVNANASCSPVANAVVDVWHCDASGLYSGYPGQLGSVDARGQTFLRGSQVTDVEGRVAFQTIYPGWYPGRTTHIHFTVHLGRAREATSQIYFPEDVTAAVYRAPPYATRGQKDTSNASDDVGRRSLPPLATVTRQASGYAATPVVGVAA